MRRPRHVLILFVVGLLISLLPVTAQGQQPSAVVVDREMTPTAGTIDLLTVQRVLGTFEDRFLPPTRFDETTPLRQAFGIGYRLGKLLALDIPQDHFLMVIAHEVYGHGARLREIGVPDIRYHFDPPIPYGSGGASTEFEGEVVVTRADRLAIDTGGIEAQNVLADNIGRQAVVRGAISHREAWLYLESRLDGLGYIRSVSPQSPSGHDVGDFLRDFNDRCDPPACRPLDASNVKRRALLMLADPLLADAAYGVAVSYLIRGREFSAVPMIPLTHNVRYLPALRFELTPYGTAWTTEHTFVDGDRLTTVSLGFGDTGRRRVWDVGVLATDVVRRERFTARLSADVWRQPPLDAPPNSLGLATGGLVAATAHMALDSGLRIGLYLQGGYKSDGFARGERLRAGPILRAGLTLGL